MYQSTGNWDEGKLHRHLTSVSFLGQTLWSRPPAVWKTCSEGSQMVWTWPVRSGVSTCWSSTRPTDSLRWVSRPGRRVIYCILVWFNIYCMLIFKDVYVICVSMLVSPVWTPSWATSRSRGVPACSQPHRHRSWRSWWGPASGTRSASPSKRKVWLPPPSRRRPPDSPTITQWVWSTSHCLAPNIGNAAMIQFLGFFF